MINEINIEEHYMLETVFTSPGVLTLQHISFKLLLNKYWEMTHVNRAPLYHSIVFDLISTCLEGWSYLKLNRFDQNSMNHIDLFPLYATAQVYIAHF